MDTRKREYQVLRAIHDVEKILQLFGGRSMSPTFHYEANQKRRSMLLHVQHAGLGHGHYRLAEVSGLSDGSRKAIELVLEHSH